MKTRTLLKFLLIPGISAILFSACEKDYVAQEPPFTPPTGDSQTIFFKAGIEPILNSNCGSSCHSASGPSYPFLNLTTGNAYDALMKNPNGKAYIDTINPESSLFYQKIKTGGSMNGYGVTPAFLKEFRTWIYEGALNN